MYRFTITPATDENGEYFLDRDIQGFYHTDYIGYERRNEIENYPMYLLTLKNDPNMNWWASKLQSAQQELLNVLINDLPSILNEVPFEQLTVCVIPRSKTDIFYRQDQLLFKATVRTAINQLGHNFIDGTDYIQRQMNTKTTHLRKPMEGFVNDGSEPYPGISLETCNFSANINGKNILLIDDIYTKTVNIDEDMIQALLSRGANTVTFYAIGNTIQS